MRSLLFIVLFSVLAGCETIHIKSVSEDHNFSEEPGVGYVFGTISQTFIKKERSDFFNDTYISRVFIDKKIKNAKKTYVASVIGGENNDIDPDFPGENGNLFIFKMPVGEHQLDHWSAQEAYTTLTPVNALIPIRFQVTEGDILYIGNIHMDLGFGKNFLGAPVTSDAVPKIRHKFKRDKLLLVKKHPKIQANRVINNPLKEGFWAQEEE